MRALKDTISALHERFGVPTSRDEAQAQILLVKLTLDEVEIRVANLESYITLLQRRPLGTLPQGE